MNQLQFSPSSDESFERPLAITIICIVGFIGAALSVPMIFSDIALQIGNWFPPYSGFVAAISFICMLGLWNTRRWAAHAYTALVIVNQLVLLLMNQWNMFTLIAQVVVVFITLYYLDAKAKGLSDQLLRYLRRQAWAIIVAYMVGIHNFYKGEQKTPEDIVIKIEDIEEQEDSSPKD